MRLKYFACLKGKTLLFFFFLLKGVVAFFPQEALEIIKYEGQLFIKVIESNCLLFFFLTGGSPQSKKQMIIDIRTKLSTK